MAFFIAAAAARINAENRAYEAACRERKTRAQELGRVIAEKNGIVLAARP